jgi:hypothetical protein
LSSIANRPDFKADAMLTSNVCHKEPPRMSTFWRNLLCILAGLISGYVGFLIVAIFWPLLFPATIQGTSWGEDTGLVIAVIAFFAFFFVAGLLFCRRLTRNFVRDRNRSTTILR